MESCTFKSKFNLKFNLKYDLKIKRILKLEDLYVYTPSQKFDMIKFSILRDVTKLLNKSTILKMSKTYFCIIIMPKSY